MASDDLVQSRRSLAAGVGITSRRDKVLPAPISVTQIPARVGIWQQREPEVNITPPACLGSNWWTYTSGSTWYPRAWHSDLDTLVSSDGVMRLDRQAHKRISFSGSKPSLSTAPIHVCFASSTVPAVPEPGAALSDWHMVETSYANREWHPVQTVRYFPLGLIGAGQRIKSIELQQHGTGYKFRWRFKTLADATLTGTTPTCLNRSADETRILDRVFNNNGTAQPRWRLTKFSLVTADGKKGEVEQRSAPWGFLPATTFAHTAVLEGTPGADESNWLNMSDLSRILSVGQPYHGVCTPTGIETLAGAPLPKPANPMSYSAPQNQQTRYFKHPSPPGVPGSNLLPPDYASAGYEFRDDVIFCGGQQYGPVGTWMLPTSRSWLHVDSAGVCRVLGLELVSDTASTTTWNVVRYDLLPGPLQTTYTIIGQIAITTTDATLVAAVPSAYCVRTYTGSIDYQQKAGGSGPENPPTRESTYALHLNRLWMVESSPDGRKIAVMRGIWNPGAITSSADGGQRSCIATVATFEVDGAYTISGPTYEWQYSHTYQQDADYTITHCIGFAFKPDGELFKWLMTEQYQSLGLLDVDAGPAEDFHWCHKLLDVSYNGTSVEPYVPPWPEGYFLYLDMSKRFWPWSSWYVRLSNNLIAQVIQYQDYDGDPAMITELSAPSGAVDYYATMPSGIATNGRAASWNPKTGQIAARTNSARISWI
jgi:hypothetical protein